MMIFLKWLKNICSPSLVFFIMSIIALILILIQNFGNNNNKYQVGSFSCRVPNIYFIFFIKLLYILLWTWILNLICKDGYSIISWLLVLFPFLLMFVIIGIIMLNM